jgi:hypothetical protein
MNNHINSVYQCWGDFFSRKCRRTVCHYIIRKLGQEPLTTVTTIIWLHSCLWQTKGDPKQTHRNRPSYLTLEQTRGLNLELQLLTKFCDPPRPLLKLWPGWVLHPQRHTGFGGSISSTTATTTTTNPFSPKQVGVGRFHIVQDPKMMSELIPCFKSPLAAIFVLSHQLSKECSFSCGASIWCQSDAAYETRIVLRTHKTRGGGQWTLQPGHIKDISPDEGGRVVLNGQL